MWRPSPAGFWRRRALLSLHVADAHAAAVAHGQNAVLQAGLHAGSTSGDIDFTAADTTGSLAARTISGDIRIWTDSSPLQRVTLGSTSGNITLSLPLYEQGFTLDFKTVSGDLTVPDSTSRPSSKNGTYIYEGGGCEIEAETVSGNLDPVVSAAVKSMSPEVEEIRALSNHRSP